jgi:olefin beta-lactone synthetase
MSSTSSDLVVARILRHGADTPERVALIHPAGDGFARVTYGELRARVQRVAGGLAARGVRRGDRVVVLVPMSPELYVVLLAVASLGAIAVFVEPASTLKEMARAIRVTRAKAFIGIAKAHALRVRFPAETQTSIKIVVGASPWVAKLLDAEPLEALDGVAPDVSLDPQEPALLTFSSGSTGVPKGATRSHAFLGHQHEAIAGLLGPAEIHMSAFAIVLLSTLVSGRTAVIPPIGRGVDDLDGERVAQAIEELGVTAISGSPAFLAPIIHAAGTRLRKVTRVVSGGAPVPVDLCEAAVRALPSDATFLVVYGSTEAEPIATIDAREVAGGTADATRAGAGLCVGHPHPHITLRLLRPSTAPIVIGPGGVAALEVPRGTVGEVVVTGDHVNRRYYRNPAAERVTKIVDERGAIWHRTGDAAYLDEHGRVWLVGRISDIVRRGEAVYHPSAVEAAARTLPWVARAALVGDGRGGTLLVVEPSNGHRGRSGELTELLAARGIAIDHVAFAKRLPVDPRHRAKLDYPAIRRRWSNPEVVP